MTKLDYANFYEQVGTPLIPDDMPTDDPNPEDLMIPTRAQLEERQAKEGKDDDTQTSGAEGAGSDKGSDGPGVSGKGDKKSEKSGDDAGDKGEKEAEDAETVLEGPGDNEVYQTTLEDPGEYEPADYSFEAVVYDEDGKNGKTVKITSVEQFEQLLDEEKNFGSASALLKAQRLATKMESNAERDKGEHDKQKAAYEAQQIAVDQQNAVVNQAAAELNYLVTKGKLPVVAKEYVSADWSNPEVAKQPGVKEQLELLKYMGKENASRRKAGLADLTPTTAFTEMRAEAAEAKLRDGADAAGVARRAASARVAGTSPAPTSAVPKGVSVGRSFGSLDELSNML